MKILKLKSILFSLMAIVMVTVFLSSCEKENSIQKTVEEATFENSTIFKLSNEFNEMSDVEVLNYLENLTDEERTNLTTDEVESRGACGNWIYIGNSWYKRWCGPPSYGAYEYMRLTIGFVG